MRWSNSSSLQRLQRPVALLGEREPPLARPRPGVVEHVVGRRRLAQERPRDEQHEADGEHRRENEREGHARTAAPAVPYRSARRRSSRASGQSAITEPSTNTKPASQIRFTTGFTSTLK